MYKALTLIFILIVTTMGNTMKSPCLVDTPYGPVLGSLRYTSSSTPYYSFQGIPYASPPIDTLRLLPPIPPSHWSSPLDLTGDSDIMCPQLSETVSGDLLGQEDCLYINVYTPTIQKQGQSNDSVPVLVWLYGGGFVTGSGRMIEYGPEKWLDEGIIVVTVNYR